MKRTVRLSIPKPCSENWHNLQQTDDGGLCNRCQKTVVNFTKMTDEQIKTFFSQQSKSTCGRFRKGQIKTYIEPKESATFRNYGWIRAGILSASLTLIASPTLKSKGLSSPIISKHFIQFDESEPSDSIKPEYITVTGVVTDKEGYELPGANVIIQGRDLGTVTDLDGKFLLKNVLPGDKLLISFIGFETLEYKVDKKACLNIQLELEMTYDLMGEVVVEGLYASPRENGFWNKVSRIFRRK